jgi:hypothetical protein
MNRMKYLSVSAAHDAAQWFRSILVVTIGILVLWPLGVRPDAASLTYYVSPSGSDSSPGTESQPFRTIQRAVDVVNPGDTVIVENGVYTGTGAGTACASASRPIVCLTRGGTSTSYVTIKARNLWGARLDGQGNTSTEGFRFLATANYIRIEGFEIYGIGNATGSANAFEIYNGGHDAIIARNNIHDIGRLCTDTTNGQAGFFVQQPRVTITRNFIHDIGRFAPGESGCSPSTGYYKNHDHGIYVDGQAEGSGIPGASGATISDNIFSNHKSGWAIQIYPGSLSGLSIVNNTFAFPNPYADGQIILGANTSDARIQNNTFYKPKGSAIYYYTGTQTNLKVTNNVVYGAALTSATPSGMTFSGNATADPQFVNAQVAPGTAQPSDFELKSTSPAIDRGVPVAAVTVDYDGMVRDSAPDAGAFEYGSAPVATNTPPVVTILTPTSNATVAANTSVTLSGTAVDGEDGDLGSTISWTSSLQGSLGTGATLARTLVAGTHVITARATDSSGASGSSAVTVNVTSGSPTTTGISITVKASRVNKKRESVQIAWSGATGSSVDIYRNTQRLTTTNDGSYTDTLRTPGTYSYKVCQQGSSVCSASASVSW